MKSSLQTHLPMKAADLDIIFVVIHSMAADVSMIIVVLAKRIITRRMIIATVDNQNSMVGSEQHGRYQSSMGEYTELHFNISPRSLSKCDIYCSIFIN